MGQIKQGRVWTYACIMVVVFVMGGHDTEMALKKSAAASIRKNSKSTLAFEATKHFQSGSLVIKVVESTESRLQSKRSYIYFNLDVRTIMVAGRSPSSIFALHVYYTWRIDKKTNKKVEIILKVVKMGRILPRSCICYG